MTHQAPTIRAIRHGLTLVELLVALAVISVLAGIALPTVKNSLQEQKVSRASTLVQSAFEEARARAIAGGGGGGLIIDRLAADSLAGRCESVRLRMADTPPSYRGEFGNGVVRYQWLADDSAAGPIDNPAGPRGIPATADATNPFRDYHVLLFSDQQSQMLRSARDIDAGDLPTLINRGDVIRLGNEGLPFMIDRVFELTAANAPAPGFWGVGVINEFPNYPAAHVMVDVIPLEPNTDLRRFSGTSMEFEISRSPRQAIAAPVELPRGTSIDLTSSGVGRYGNQFSPMEAAANYVDTALPPFTGMGQQGNYQSIFVLFGSRGGVDRVLAAQGLDGNGIPQLFDIPVTGDLHFLVSEAGQVKTEPDDQLENNDPNPFADAAKDGITPLLNPESIWVTVKARSGEVITSPWIDPTDENTALIPTVANVPDQRERIRTVIGRTRTDAVD